MDININAVKFTADPKLEEFINGKVEKLSKYSDDIIGAEVFLRVDKPQSEDNKIVEIKLNVPKAEFFAKKQSSSFEESVDSACEALKKQIIKQKEKVKAA
ncbi:ribosome-associated translation inhibitor RaiA [Bacteroidales bacterium]|nr:ribosome-associated translation inhibitor RaiA [Bacteroidales bacterium]